MNDGKRPHERHERRSDSNIPLWKSLFRFPVLVPQEMNFARFQSRRHCLSLTVFSVSAVQLELCSSQDVSELPASVLLGLTPIITYVDSYN